MESKKRAHVRLIACLSIDGRISRAPDALPNQVAKGGWTSAADKDHFRTELDRADIVLMGRRTFEMTPSMGKPTAVLTHKSIVAHSINKSIIELLDGKRDKIVQWLESIHNSRVLLCGGAEAYTTLLQMGLVDSMSIVIEPLALNVGPSFTTQRVYWPETQMKKFKHIRTNALGSGGSGTIAIEYGSEDAP